MDHLAVGALVRGDHGRTPGRDGTGRCLVGRGPGFEAKRRGSCRPLVGDTGRCAHHADVRPVGSQTDPQRRLLEQVDQQA
jgi:hypothetical protein